MVKSLFIRTCLETDFNFLASAKLVIPVTEWMDGWMGVVRPLNKFSLDNSDRGGSNFSSIFFTSTLFGLLELSNKQTSTKPKRRVSICMS